MNPPDSNDPLSDALRQWRLKPPSNSNFRPEVWARIRRKQRGTWGAYVRGHAAALSIAAVMTLFVSGWAGNAAGQAKIHADREAMVVAYLVELDPRVQATLQH